MRPRGSSRGLPDRLRLFVALQIKKKDRIQELLKAKLGIQNVDVEAAYDSAEKKAQSEGRQCDRGDCALM
jgi:hypothetical protein